MLADDALAVAAFWDQAPPSLTERQAISLLEAIPIETLQGIRDLALMSVFFITGCRVSAIVQACVGHLETDGVEHYLHVTEKRNKKRRKILLDAARPVRAYLEHRGHRGRQGRAAVSAPEAGRHRTGTTSPGPQTPWRLVKKYCRTAGIDPDRLGGRGIGIHSLRKTAINDAIRNGASHARGAGVRRATPISEPPRSTSCAKRKTRRWRRGGSTFASRDARASESVGDRPRDSRRRTGWRRTERTNTMEGTYTMPKTCDRLPLDSKGERP